MTTRTEERIGAIVRKHMTPAVVLDLQTTFVNRHNLKPAIIAAIFDCGHVPNGFGESDHYVVIALEIGESTALLRDPLPAAAGGVIHNLHEAVTGNGLCDSARIHALDPKDLLGAAIMVEVVRSETFAALRQCQPWPRRPRNVPAGTPADDFKVVVPPLPRNPPRFWTCSEMKERRIELPIAVRLLAQQSAEWQTQTPSLQ